MMTPRVASQVDGWPTMDALQRDLTRIGLALIGVCVAVGAGLGVIVQRAINRRV